ncbi:MAG: GNAT family N-acetyltransferase [Myxococcota bacterium]
MGEVKREELSDSKGRYVYASDAGQAEMTFSKAGDSLIIIDHTDVSDGLRGKGIGAKLVAQAVSDAREGHYKILPLCPFAAKTFRDHPEWADIKS